ncbi:zinc finger (C3HC4 RING finger) protein, putative [Eimeria brunetti]|uniref:RING-type E3 ubiquitin transferase n=1 Tax=Eimeria brunetti TaxID=51314 RepID=U6LSL9_9EIME|nr:zinc finger (C3HC4 RING finger) protein, putative [Eimeria brunetti]
MADSGLPTLPTPEELMRWMRSFENLLSGVSAPPYTNMRGLSSTVDIPFVSALQRPRSNTTDHRSHNYEPRSPVSVIDERYVWGGDGARPRRSSGDSGVFLRSSGRSQGATLFDNLFGDSLGARLHRNAAANMVRSFLSSLIGPVSLPLRGPWEFRVELLHPTSHRTERHSHTRRIIETPSPSLVLFAHASANPANFDVLEHNIGRFIDEIERSFALDDFDDLDSPLMLVVSGGNAGDGDDFVPHIWADTSGSGVTLQQLSEARSLRENLGHHTHKWIFGEDKHGDGHPTAASHDAKAPAGTSGGKAQQAAGGLGRVDASTDAATDGSAVGAEPETRNGYDCCICLSAFEPGDALLTLRCLHIFHERCIDRWIRTSHSVKCPLCSTKIAESPDGEQIGAQ